MYYIPIVRTIGVYARTVFKSHEDTSKQIRIAETLLAILCLLPIRFPSGVAISPIPEHIAHFFLLLGPLVQRKQHDVLNMQHAFWHFMRLGLLSFSTSASQCRYRTLPNSVRKVNTALGLYTRNAERDSQRRVRQWLRKLHSPHMNSRVLRQTKCFIRGQVQ